MQLFISRFKEVQSNTLTNSWIKRNKLISTFLALYGHGLRLSRTNIDGHGQFVITKFDYTQACVCEKGGLPKGQLPLIDRV
jgi:hypothetical protein